MLGMTFDIQTHLALLAVSGTGSLSGLPTIRPQGAENSTLLALTHC
jgi:hypothetical protein